MRDYKHIDQLTELQLADHIGDLMARVVELGSRIEDLATIGKCDASLTDQFKSMESEARYVISRMGMLAVVRHAAKF